MVGSKELLIVAGPNGSGKTTFALECIARNSIPYLSADAIAEEIAPENPAAARIPAGRRFLTAVDQRLSGSESFVIETTLSGIGFRRTLAEASRHGFMTSIVYLYVSSPDTCIARVRERVRKGGHDVPDEDVRRRFWRSLTNFWDSYRHLADHWILAYNTMERLYDVAVGSGASSSVKDPGLFADFLTLLEASKHG